MRIQITEAENGHTSVKVDGAEVNQVISGFSLSQKPGETPVLLLEIPVTEGMEIDLPQGIVIAQHETDTE